MSGRGYNTDEKRIKDPTKFRKERVYIQEEHIICKECGSKIYIDENGDPEICSNCDFDPLYPIDEDQPK